MTKDIEWAKKQIILEITESTDRQNPQFYANFYIDVGLKMALSFLDQLDEPETLSQELPVIPKFVSDYIKWYEKSFIYTFDTDAEYIIYLLKVPLDFMGCKRVKDWRDKSGNAQKLIDAYRRGYEVEKEQKYYARIKGWENVTIGSEAFNWVYFKEKDTVGISKAVENKYQAVSFTKYDWNNLGINDDNADFVKVEELEE